MKSNTSLEVLSSGKKPALLHGCHEIVFASDVVDRSSDPLPIQVCYILPSGAHKRVRAFRLTSGEIKSRAYIEEEGLWMWDARDRSGASVGSGNFHSLPSKLPGKLSVSRISPFSFANSNATAYLYFGDTAHRYPVSSEEQWKGYIEQAAQAGLNSIRVSLVDAANEKYGIFDNSGRNLNLPYWDEIDKRFHFALKGFPSIQFQVCPFGSSEELVERFESGDPVMQLALEYAVERFSPYPNIHWCASDSLPIDEQQATNTIGHAISKRDAWNSLITSIPSKMNPPTQAKENWCSYICLNSIDQVSGRSILETRKEFSKPIVLAEDRHEHKNAPNHPRFYFRRLYWGSILSGGFPSYGGLTTDQESNGHSAGIRGYYDACHAGVLRQGAHDVLNVRNFFRDTGIDPASWIPDDSIGGNEPFLIKAMKHPSNNECIAYASNPDAVGGGTLGNDDSSHSIVSLSSPNESFTTITLELPFESGTIRWFNPATSEWKGEAEVTRHSTTLLTPAPGDWVIWAKRKQS